MNHAFNTGTYTPPATIWAGLYTSLPTSSAGGGVEVTASDYARVSTTWGIASLGESQNSTAIRFPATGTTLSNWGTVLGLGLFDASHTGNLLWFGSLSAPVVLSLGTDFNVAALNLTVSLS